MRWNLWRKRRETDLDEEIAYDLALDAEERIQSGMSREEAGRSSRRDFGNVGLVKEGVREIWGWALLHRLRQDLRYGWRSLRRNPMFTAMAVLSLALGIGANAAIYSFMDAILMRALPVRNPRELVILNWHTKDFPRVVRGLSGTWYGDRRTGFTSGNYPFPAFEFLRAQNTVLSSLFAFEDWGRLNLMVQGQAELAGAQFGSGGFFNGIRVPPAAGRLIADDDDRTGAEPVVAISYRYWQRRFAASPGAVGQSIVHDNPPFIIAGV